MTTRTIADIYKIDEDKFLDFLINNNLEFTSGMFPSVDNDKVKKYVSLFLSHESEKQPNQSESENQEKKQQETQPQFEVQEEEQQANNQETETEKTMITSYSAFIMNTGKNLYGYARKGIVLGLPILIGSLLLFLIAHYIAQGSFQTFLSALSFRFDMLDFLQAVFVICFYLLASWVVTSPIAFLFGVHFIGLGQIAKNTDK